MTLLLTICIWCCVCVLGLPLLIIAGSCCIGLYLALRELWCTLREEHLRAGERLYILERGPRTVRAIATRQFKHAFHRAEQWQDHAATVRYLAFTRLGPLQYPAWLIIAALHIAARMHYVLAALFVVLCSGIFTIILLVLAVITLSSLALLAALTSLTSFSRRLLDLRYFCPQCYSSTDAPLSLCPDCQTGHPHLRPDMRGVLVHRCTHCQRRLPTLDLFGHHRLKRACPRCQHLLPSAPGTARVIHIALIGGIGAGKTTCLVNSLHPLLAAQQVKFIDQEQQKSFAHMQEQLSRGEAFSEVSEPDCSALMLRLRSPRALLYLYDPAGSVFMSSERLSQQSYYQQSQGFLFIIDPLAIPAFYQRHKAKIEQLFPSQRAGQPDVERLYERMMRALEIHTRLRPGQRFPQSIAVVITRVDQLHLETEIGANAVRLLMQQEPFLRTKAEVQHQLARRFLCRYDLENMLRDLEAHFTRVRYFFSAVQPPKNEDEDARDGGYEALCWLLK